MKATQTVYVQPRSSHAGTRIAAYCSALLLLAATAFAQVGGVLPVPRQTFLDTSGNVVASGSLYTYVCGTTTDKDAYSDVGVSVALPHPITLNSAGRPQTGAGVETAVYLAAACYKFVLKDSGGSTLWTQDNIYPPNYLGSGTLGSSYFLRGDATSGYTWARPVTVITTTSTGTQNDFAPGLVGDTVIRCSNASLLTVNGFASGYDGQRVYLVSIGAGQVDLAHQNTGSSAANRLINFATSGSTSLAAGSGTALYIYDGTTARWRMVSHEQGAFITPTFAAGDYTASAGTWTVDSGDVTTFAYRLQGRTITILFRIETTDVSTTPATLIRTIPGGFTATKAVINPVFADDATTVSIGYSSVAAGGALQFGKATGNWTATSSDNTRVIGEIVLEVN